jgi:tetratricopeptide (TPR) repeat protein
MNDTVSKELAELERRISLLRTQATPSMQLIDALNDLVYLLQSVDIQRAIKVAQEAYGLSQLLRHHMGIAVSMSRLSWLYLQSGLFDAAVRDAHHALFLAEWFNDYLLITRANYVLAASHRMAGDYKKAEARWSKMLELARLHKDRMREADHLIALGYVFEKSGDLARAIEYYRSANDAYTEIDDPNHVLAKNNTAFALILLGRNEEGLVWVNVALQSCDPARQVWRGALLHTLGLAHLNLRQYDLARAELAESLEISRSPIGETEVAVRVLIDIAKLELVHNRLPDALAALAQAVNLAHKIHAVGLEADANEALFRLHTIVHDHVRANEYHERYLQLRAQVHADRVDKQMRLIRIEVEAEQQLPLWRRDLNQAGLVARS